MYEKGGVWMKLLTRTEEIYLLAILGLKDDAYGVQIKKQVAEISGKEISYGALYFALEQLHNKGYVTRRHGVPTPVRGGCSKIYYKLSPEGKKSLKDAFALHHSIWAGISVNSF